MRSIQDLKKKRLKECVVVILLLPDRLGRYEDAGKKGPTGLGLFLLKKPSE